MNPKITKLKEDRTKLAARLKRMQQRLEEMDQLILELENTDIVGIVRENGVTIDQLAELLELLEKKPTAAIEELEQPIPDEIEEDDETDEEI